MAVDAQRVMQLIQSLNQLWSAPFQICVAIYFLYVTMGVAVLAGLGMLIMLIPLNLLITRLARKIQVITAVFSIFTSNVIKTKNRIHSMNRVKSLGYDR